KRAITRLLAWIQRTRWKFKQLFAGCVTILSNQEDIIRSWASDNTYGARMNHQFDRMFLAVLVDDMILSDFDFLAFIHNFLGEDFYRAHACGSFCASRTGRSARMNLSICFSVMM